MSKRKQSTTKKRKGPSRLARILATTALNFCVSYHNRADVYGLAQEMDYCLKTGKSIRRISQR